MQNTQNSNFSQILEQQIPIYDDLGSYIQIVKKILLDFDQYDKLDDQVYAYLQKVDFGSEIEKLYNS